jgi:Leucine-rich repeat (LRR) protein
MTHTETVRSESPRTAVMQRRSSGTRRQRQRIPADLVQTTAEYLGRVAGLLSFRGVSTAWQGAVSDAVGFLNGRCWNHLEKDRDAWNETAADSIWSSLRLNDAATAVRCAVLCLQSRLETLELTCCRLPLQLLGRDNTTLTALTLDEVDIDFALLERLLALRALRLRAGTFGAVYLTNVSTLGRLARLETLDLTRQPLNNLNGLQHYAALRELTASFTFVTNASFEGLEGWLAQLHKLDLSGCHKLTAISNLAPCVALRELNLSDSDVEDLRGLEKLVALETLDVSHLRVREWSVLRQCPRLTALTVSRQMPWFSALVDNAAHCLVHCRGNVRGRLYADSQASLPRLVGAPMLQTLDLAFTSLHDVRALADCRVLRDLNLRETAVTDETITGLERIPTLEKLDLSACRNITAVAGLRRCVALRELLLSATPVTDAGLEGLECIASLSNLQLDGCFRVTGTPEWLTEPSTRHGSYDARAQEQEKASLHDELDDDATTLSRCSALRSLNLSGTGVTNAGLAALARLPVLESLKLAYSEQLRDVSSLSGSVSLCELDLSYTNLRDPGIAGLERIPTLTSLQLAGCQGITNVQNLARSRSLRQLDLRRTAVHENAVEYLVKAPALETLYLLGYVELRDSKAAVQHAARYGVKAYAFGKWTDAD